MATRKKKKSEQEIISEVSKLIAEETLQATEPKPEKKVWPFPYTIKGNHLTVTEYEDGRTELEWDDEALLQEVRAAIASVKK